MAEMRFTPGPWVVSEGNDNVGERDGVWGSVRGDGGYYLARIWNDASGIDAEANARLIAAAPDGYALAEEVVNHLYTLQDIARVRQIAKDFLAKAVAA